MGLTFGYRPSESTKEILDSFRFPTEPIRNVVKEQRHRINAHQHHVNTGKDKAEFRVTANRYRTDRSFHQGVKLLKHKNSPFKLIGLFSIICLAFFAQKEKRRFMLPSKPKSHRSSSSTLRAYNIIQSSRRSQTCCTVRY